MTPDAMAALHCRCFTAPPPWSAKSFASLLSSPHVFHRFEASGQAFVIGRVIVDEAELLTLATAPEARRMGLGRRMISEFEAEAFIRGAKTAFLEVAEDNIPARTLYEQLGYEPKGERPGYYVGENGQAISAMILCKSLA